MTRNVIKSIHIKINEVSVKSLSTISPFLSSKILYRKKFSKKLDLKNPKTFNEKLMWLKLYSYNDNRLVTQCADKYRVRNYIISSGYGYILNELIGAWDLVDQINWDILPDKFVLKCNHGAGYNIICENKKSFDVQEAKKKLNNWMKEDYWKKRAEVNYKNITKKIICERFIETSDGSLPKDYKIYCFNGEPLFIGNYIERDKRTMKIKRGYFNFDWEPQNFIYDDFKENENKFNRPNTLDEMYKISKDLSKPFPFVRVDLYESNNKVVFGEMTFTPAACLANYFTESGSFELGEKLKLPKK